ncbi:MAG: energy-coupling factor transporter ATPase [Christensenellales bacterium]
MEIIKLNNVSYRYRQGGGALIEALKNISVSIYQGEFIVLIGKNGSGKSTFAKMLNGLYLPTEGDVEVFGINTCNSKRIFDIRAKVGMVFQNPDNQMIASIVEDDIAFGPENLGIEREEIIRRVDWALAAVGMSGYRKSTPFKMSGGQKQRIAIAAVLAVKPEVLVLDESTAMLDPKGRREVMEVLKSLNKNENITIIHITHNMEEAIGADRVMVLNDGELVLDDTPEIVFTEEELLNEYNLDLPLVTEIQMALNKTGFNIDGFITNEKELAEKICRLL